MPAGTWRQFVHCHAVLPASAPIRRGTGCGALQRKSDPCCPSELINNGDFHEHQQPAIPTPHMTDFTAASSPLTSAFTKAPRRIIWKPSVDDFDRKARPRLLREVSDQVTGIDQSVEHGSG